MASENHSAFSDSVCVFFPCFIPHVFHLHHLVQAAEMTLEPRLSHTLTGNDCATLGWGDIGKKYRGI